MRSIALGAALVMTAISWSAMAEEEGAMHGKPSIEDQCRAMAVQHGMKGDKVEAWVQTCLEMAAKMKHDREMSGGTETQGGNDMQDVEEGASGDMSHKGK